MSTEFGFNFDKNKCIQCFGCEVACKTWRNGEYGVRWRRVKNIWSGSFPKVKMESVSVSCMHCEEPACIKACPVKAITKRADDGIVLVDRKKCVGCKSCARACPYGAPQFGADRKMQKCDMCINDVDVGKDMPPCVATCPTKALQLAKLEKGVKIKTQEDIKKLLERT
ncbi:MAG: 4Fe-4S dicluster domain-containing protein [Syntrophorhabdaceae bacterium]|nr:4Fe-4S dicluster domain-containing protein [Syntrophorhabdaceae bacterium]